MMTIWNNFYIFDQTNYKNEKKYYVEEIVK